MCVSVCGVRTGYQGPESEHSIFALSTDGKPQSMHQASYFLLDSL